MSAEIGHLLLIGSGGLVGRHVRAAALREGVPVSVVAVPWEDPAASVTALTAAMESFLAAVPVHTPWSIIWAAGAGVVATGEEALASELAVFTGVMSSLDHLLPAPDARQRDGGLAGRGCMVLVSSAGGVHAGSADPPFNEQTPPRPLVAYGWTKLAMETVAAQRCQAHGIPLLIARLSNVYGPGQRLAKPQGLISQICLSHVTGAPLPVYVSHDTLRDYVYAPDAAGLLLAGVARLQTSRPREPVVKIIADGAPITVGHLVGEARRVLRRPLRTVTVAGQGSGQVLDLRFRSRVWTDLDAVLRTPLPAGLAATAADVAERVARGGELDQPE